MCGREREGRREDRKGGKEERKVEIAGRVRKENDDQDGGKFV